MARAMRKEKRILEVMVTRFGNAYVDGLLVERDELSFYVGMTCEFKIIPYCHLVSLGQIEEVRRILLAGSAT
jgi:hypothetical protein